MGADRYAVAHLEEIAEVDDGRQPFRAVRHHFGITSFGVTSWTAREVGDQIINEHDESEPDSPEELYLVMSGHATFELDGESVDAPQGTFVFVPPGIKRTAFAQESGTTVIALGGQPGRAYEPSGWELWAPLLPLYQAGRYDEVADGIRAVIEAGADYPTLYYNLACTESMAGRTADAIEHLRNALTRSPALKQMAESDSDLDPLREDPEFQALLAG